MARCSNCEKRLRKCVVAEDAGRCGECARRGLKCDALGPSMSDQKALEKEEARLDTKREETLAKLMRLDKQQRLFKRRARDMLRRGLKTMDELDAAEEAEAKAKADEAATQLAVAREAAAFAEILNGAEIQNPSCSDPSLSELPWLLVDNGGGSPQEVPSNSQGS